MYDCDCFSPRRVRTHWSIIASQARISAHGLHFSKTSLILTHCWMRWKSNCKSCDWLRVSSRHGVNSAHRSLDYHVGLWNRVLTTWLVRIVYCCVGQSMLCVYNITDSCQAVMYIMYVSWSYFLIDQPKRANLRPVSGVVIPDNWRQLRQNTIEPFQSLRSAHGGTQLDTTGVVTPSGLYATQPPTWVGLKSVQCDVSFRIGWKLYCTGNDFMTCERTINGLADTDAS